MIVSLFYIVFNTNYGFHFMEREYYEAYQEKLETEVRDVDEIGDVANLETTEQKERFKASRRANVSRSQEHVDHHKVRQWCARLSYTGFLGGLILLLLFAIKNM